MKKETPQPKREIRIEKAELRFYGIVLKRNNVITEVDAQHVFISESNFDLKKGFSFSPGSIGFSVDEFLKKVQSLNAM